MASLTDTIDIQSSLATSEPESRRSPPSAKGRTATLDEIPPTDRPMIGSQGSVTGQHQSVAASIESPESGHLLNLRPDANLHGPVRAWLKAISLRHYTGDSDECRSSNRGRT